MASPESSSEAVEQPVGQSHEEVSVSGSQDALHADSSHTNEGAHEGEDGAETVQNKDHIAEGDDADVSKEGEDAVEIKEQGDAESGNEKDDVPEMDEELHRLSKHRREAPKVNASGESQERRRRPQRDSKKDKPEKFSTEELELGDGEEILDDATRERRALEARIDAVLQPSSKRRKKLAGDDLEMLQDETIAKLRDAMREAALSDVECIKQGLPAINKVKMLPEAVQLLRKNQLADSILDGNLLESVRIWLEPLPDASLPSFEIQKAMFNALLALPIKTIHLRESGLGRVVLFYQKSKRPQPVIKRIAQKLLGDWTRPIIGRSDNYRDKQVATANYDPQDRRSRLTSKTSAPTPYEESAARRGRAAIPSASGVNYQVAPVSEVPYGAVNTPPVQSKDSQIRRMKTKLMSSGHSGRSGRSGRKSQVSVEGRGLN